MISMKQTWRWFGPDDPVPLSHIKMAGATGIVTALHHLPNGVKWPLEEIEKRKNLVQKSGLSWDVVESIPVHEDIKTMSGKYQLYIENYKESLINLAKAGISTVCYNFMPVLDWTRTNLEYPYGDGAKALHFSMVDYRAFDLFILGRSSGSNEYADDEITVAKQRFDKMSADDRDNLTRTILMGLPGSEESFGLPEFGKALAKYENISAEILCGHLGEFLRQIMPVAEELGIRMAIHPDDPPYNLFGLPRVVSNESDILNLLSVYDSAFNGITLCTGSLGVNPAIDLPGLVKKVGRKLNFIHLRNVSGSKDGSFTESNHLEGNTDMYEVIKEILIHMNSEGRAVPMRPDHGHLMLDDLEKKKSNPGYSAIGRLRGLAELRGMEMAILRQF